MHLATSLGEYVRDWGTAIGTVGATLVALWVVWQGRRARPTLELTYDLPDGRPPDVLPVPENVGHDGKTTLIAYTYLTVTNTKRRAISATGVEVFVKLVEVVESTPGHAAQTRFGLGDMSLKWSNSMPEDTVATVSPKAPRRLDFLRVENGSHAAGDIPLIVEVRPEPANQRHYVRGAKIRFELLLTASNADARQYTVMVGWDGSFPVDAEHNAKELWRHLTISPPQRV